MDNAQIVFLVVGVVIVAAVGRLLAFSGRRYLTNSAPRERRASGPAATLVTALFHLLTLGVVALLAVLPMGGSTGPDRFLLRLGILLIVLAGIYGITLTLLGRQRQEALAAEIVDAHRPGNDEVRVEPATGPLDRNPGTRRS